MALDTFKVKVNGIIARLSRLPQRERWAAFMKELDALDDPDEREIALNLVSTAVDLSAEPDGMKTWEKVTMMASGGVFVVVLLAIALLIPNPSMFQIFVFRVVLALASAAFGCAIPGILNIKGELANFSVRAGGALGLFLLVYSFNPPAFIQQKEAAAAHAPGAASSTP